MEQKKAKLFHVLKIAYYCLGFPIFFLAVLCLVMQNYGHVPFMGEATGQYIAIKSVFTSPAMYSIWIALAVWAVTVIVQIVCNYLIKNRNTRVLTVMAVMLVILLLPIFIIDGVYTAKLNDLAETSPEGVVVKDYKTHLAYYRTNTSATNINGSTMKVSFNDTLKSDILEFCTTYNVPYNGQMFHSTAGSFENEGLRYDDFNYDYNADGVIDSYDHVLIKTPVDDKPWGRIDKNSLTLTDCNGENPKTFEGEFFCMKYVQQVSPDSSENVDCYVWYRVDKTTPVESEGYYGKAYYNTNGMLADGYVFSVEVALNILEEYYQAEEDMKELFKATGYANENELRAEIKAGAMARLEERYTGENATEEEKFLWEKETSYAASHSLTIVELNSVLAELGSVVGSAQLITNLLPIVEMIGLNQLQLGAVLDMVLGGTMPETLGFLKANLGDLANITITITASPNLTLKLSNLPNGASDLTIVMDENFSTATIKSLLDEIGITNGMLAEVLSLVGFSAKADDNSLAGLENMLAGVLETLYWYRSPVIAPEYDYYVDPALDASVPEEKALMDYQAAYAKHQRAYYEGSFHGALVGSKLIGAGVGLGTDMFATGHITTLQQVQQLQADLSILPEMYSVLIVRDMLMTFAGLILLFTVLSYMASEKEYLWATGQVEAKEKGKLASLIYKIKNGKKADVEESVDEDNSEEINEEINVEYDEIAEVEAEESLGNVDENNEEVE